MRRIAHPARLRALRSLTPVRPMVVQPAVALKLPSRPAVLASRTYASSSDQRPPADTLVGGDVGEAATESPLPEALAQANQGADGSVFVSLSESSSSTARSSTSARPADPLPLPPASALAVLLSRLGLNGADERLQEQVTRCLTHPSWGKYLARKARTAAASAQAAETDAVDSATATSTIPAQGSSSTSIPRDPSPQDQVDDNTLLATLGNSLLGLFASEHLAHTYPFLPTDMLSAAVSGYVGPSTLSAVGRELGLAVQGGGNTIHADSDLKRRRGAAAIGMQIRFDDHVFASVRRAAERKLSKERQEAEDAREAEASRQRAREAALQVSRRGEGQRGEAEQGTDLYADAEAEAEAQSTDGAPTGGRAGDDGTAARSTDRRHRVSRKTPSAPWRKGHATFDDVVASVVRSLIGLVYQEKGVHYARQFVHSYFLSRHFDMAALFKFEQPMTTLAETVARYLSDVGVPRAKRGELSRVEVRLLASTGAHSNTPLFNVGLFLPTGLKLAEGHGSSLSMAKHRAATNALLSFYMVRGDQGFALPLSASASSSSAAGAPETLQLPTSVSADFVLPSALASRSQGREMPGEGMLAAWGKEGTSDNRARFGGRIAKLERRQERAVRL